MKEVKFSSTDHKENIARLPDRTVAIYVRVSHSSQIDNFSIPTQIQECREYIRKEKLKEVGIFIEEGESAKTSDRTQLSNLLKFISRNKNKVDYVLVYKIDRWARSQSDFFAIKSMLLKNGTNLISVCENVDDSPTGRFLEGVFSGLAQLDNELKGERVKACLATKASDGQYPGKPPYGYTNDRIRKVLIKDDVYFDAVKWALNSFANDTPIPVIAERFNLMEIKTRGANKTKPRDFKSKDVWNILCNSKFYAGYYDWGELKDIEGKHEKMIDWMTHLKIQSSLFNKKMGVTPELVEDKNHFILNFNMGNGKGFIHCDSCGERMRTCFAKGKKGTKYPYYYCKNPQCKSKKKSILKQNLEKLFEDLLVKITPTEDFTDYFSEHVMEMWEREYKQFDGNRIKAKKRLQELNVEKKETILMKKKNQLTDEEYEEEMTRIRCEIIALTSTVSESVTDRNEVQVLLTQAKLFITRIEPLYLGFSTTNKQRFISLIFPKGIRYQDGILRTPEKSYLFEFIEELEAQRLKKTTLVTLRGIEPRFTD